VRQKGDVEMPPHEKLLKSRTGCASVHVMRTEKSAIAVKTLISKLTTAERRILSLVSLAKTNKEIAVALGISPATVKRHLENVLRKLELKNRVEAALYGLIANGCPHESNSACPLKLWQNARDDVEPEWAI
jgi:DNA-binding CsgD family transcriptional regulator